MSHDTSRCRGEAAVLEEAVVVSVVVVEILMLLLRGNLGPDPHRFVRPGLGLLSVTAWMLLSLRRLMI